MKVKKVMKSMKKAPTKAMKKAPMTPKAMKAPMPEGMNAPTKAMKAPMKAMTTPMKAMPKAAAGSENFKFQSEKYGLCKLEMYSEKSYVRQMLPGGGFKSVISCCTKGVHADVCRQLVPHVEKGLCTMPPAAVPAEADNTAEEMEPEVDSAELAQFFSGMDGYGAEEEEPKEEAVPEEEEKGDDAQEADAQEESEKEEEDEEPGRGGHGGEGLRALTTARLDVSS
eukprot:s9880_g1.t1